MAARKNTQLVLQHLENVSWRILDQYSDAVRELIRGQAGIYALYRKDRLYYVGLATNLMSRLKAHLRDRHNGAWDRFSVYLTVDDEHMRELESLLLRIVSPSGNKVRGKFVGSESVFRHLNRRMKEIDADRRAKLLGGQVAKRRRRTKTRRGKGSQPLAGLLDRRMNLRGWRSGYEYSAVLRIDGNISFDGSLYSSPTGAAKAATGRVCNGWRFWHFRNKRKEWVPLSELRK